MLAHAAMGHNHFFKNNYVFKQWTDASGIADYLSFAKSFIAKCEERHGVEAVERLIDAAHALQSHGIHRYPGKRSMDLRSEERREQERPAHPPAPGGLLTVGFRWMIAHDWPRFQFECRSTANQ